MAEKHPAGHYGIFQQEHAHQVAEVFDRNTSPEMVEANAHLIAAAPEMLDAILAVLRSIADPDGEHSVIEKIDAAVFKALGQNAGGEGPPP